MSRKCLSTPRFHSDCVHLIFEDNNGVIAFGCQAECFSYAGCPFACEWYAYDERFLPFDFPELKEVLEDAESKRF